MIRSMSYNRYLRIPTPMLTGSANRAMPRIHDRKPGATELAPTPIPRVTAAPQASHFSCWRRSPSDLRQLRS